MTAPFPVVDPIPLPAPIWLMKALLLLTFALHVTAMQTLIGGTAAGAWWALIGRRRGDRVRLGAAGALATRLPVLMTFVINLGVPPLLFTQVLYGRLLYTSSILIGVFWISVIVLLTLGYWLLYVMSGRASKGRDWGGIGLLALAIFLFIAFIYSTNMTLMLRPEVWLEAYRGDPGGFHLAPPGDPTIHARWAYMMLGGLAVAGAAMTLLARQQTLGEGVAPFLRRRGGILLALFGAVQVGMGFRALGTYPPETRQAALDAPLGGFAAYGWLATVAVMVLAGLILARSNPARKQGWFLPLTAVLATFLNIACMVLIRDAVRDAALLARGLDVWDRQVATNWGVVGLFLVLFVVGLGAMGWLIKVVATARKEREEYA